MDTLANEVKYLGYVLHRNKPDIFGRMRKYRTAPTASAGSTCYFDTLRQLEEWIMQVKENRLAEEMAQPKDKEL